MESASVLEEFTGVTSLVLWQSLRDVTLWASTPPSARGSLFSACAERHRIATLLASSLPPELEQPLGMITGMVGRPDKVSPQRVALACRHVSQWAEKHGKLATALAFAQAGALACPGDAAAGYKVGQLARRRAEYARAETWYRRSIALGRQEGDWVSYSLAFLGLGNLYSQRGNLPAARKLHIRGLRAARRHNLRDIQGRALHDLHVIATSTGSVDEAITFAREAFHCYGPLHNQVPSLAHDVAYFWLTQGYFAPALSVFQALLLRLDHSQYWVYVLPNIVRAAGGAGQRDVFERVWTEVWEQLGQREEPGEGYAEAMLEMARGAASLGEWERAQNAATQAVAIAEERREGRIRIIAESVLESIKHDQLADRSVPAAVGAPSSDTVQFAEELVHGLRQCAAVA